MQRQPRVGSRFEALEARRVLAATVEVPLLVEAATEPAHVAEVDRPGGGDVQSNAVSSEVGDFDNDGELTANDIDILCGAMGKQVTESEFDLVPDGIVDQADMDMMVQVVMGTEYGDLNLNGDIDRDDAVTMFRNMFQSDTGWASGNFNCDGVTDGFDYIMWLNSRNMAPRVQDAGPAESSATELGAEEVSQPTVTATPQLTEQPVEEANDTFGATTEVTAVEADSSETELVTRRSETARPNRLSAIQHGNYQTETDATGFEPRISVPTKFRAIL